MLDIYLNKHWSIFKTEVCNNNTFGKAKIEWRIISLKYPPQSTMSHDQLLYFKRDITGPLVCLRYTDTYIVSNKDISTELSFLI